MKQFLMTFFSAALVLGTSFESQAEQIWVNGVTSESGWSDFDKSRSDNNDDLLCWAASASCVLDYWQSLYITSSYIPTGEDIWQCFKDSSSDQVGNPVLAIQWWICGDYSGSSDRAAISISATSVPLETDFSQFGGYYWDVIPDTNGNKVVHLDNFLYTYFSTGKNEAAAVVNRLQYAPISLGIRSEYGMMHAITLWGLEYEINSNGESEITSMWITDSDDYTNQLRELSSWHEDNDSRLFLDYFGEDEKVWLFNIHSLNVEESDTWALQRVVPEPATATLSLLALAGLTARRRRK